MSKPSFYGFYHFVLCSYRYIRMEYEPVFGLDNICKRFDDASHDKNNQFVEGLQYSLDEAVLMTAVMVPDHEVDHRNVIQILCVFLLLLFLKNMKDFMGGFPISKFRLTMSVDGISHGSSSTSRTYCEQHQKARRSLSICH